MPYEYRKISPEEQAAIVRHRRAQAFPAHAPPHPYRDARAYLVTATNFEHAPIMQDPARRTEFQTGLHKALSEAHAEAIAWVVVPNHYHVLLNVESLDLISSALKHLHGTTARKWNLEEGLTEKRRVWYKFADRAIRDEDHFYRTFNYIHWNPVKHGYTTDAYQWEWSSLMLYYEEQGREWLRSTWKIIVPPMIWRLG
jgi:putative transposase